MRLQLEDSITDVDWRRRPTRAYAATLNYNLRGQCSLVKEDKTATFYHLCPAPGYHLGGQ